MPTANHGKTGNQTTQQQQSKLDFCAPTLRRVSSLYVSWKHLSLKLYTCTQNTKYNEQQRSKQMSAPKKTREVENIQQQAGAHR
jgi:hypothetical protein